MKPQACGFIRLFHMHSYDAVRFSFKVLHRPPCISVYILAVYWTGFGEKDRRVVRPELLMAAAVAAGRAAVANSK